MPGCFGIGALGAEACRFADYLEGAGQQVWQVLPLGPTGFADSPYQCFSAFAGNPLLICLETLAEQGALRTEELDTPPPFPEKEVDFGWVIEFKYGLLRQASARFAAEASPEEREAFEAFCGEHAAWLDDFALFMAAKQAHGGAVWNTWDARLTQREPDALEHWWHRLAKEVHAQKYWQFEFHRQWLALKHYCNERGIRIMGDIPIYVAHDSADVWAHRELFHLDDEGNPSVVAGVPPDYFSATGQLWGNPIYRWERCAETGFTWWIERLRATFALVDVLRIDHFRGFEDYWEVPAGEETAENGRWVPGPRGELFRAIQEALGPLPIVAENLGYITKEVEALRKEFSFPGMGVLQFAFGPDIDSAGLLPHEYYPDMVAYTGTHDNDATLGWWKGSKEQGAAEDPIHFRKTRTFARKYLATSGRDINWVGIRAIMASVADTAVFPLQDILSLGSEARMNIPGTTGGKNWRWRFAAEQLAEESQKRLRNLTEIYGRLPRE